jgi:hypothetical protein
MSEYKYDEKDEKDLQKHEEKSYEEKSYEEKYRRDPLGTIIWALILIWAGLVFLLQNLGMLDRLQIRLTDVPADLPVELPTEAFGLFFIGAAALLAIEVIIRLITPVYRRPVMGTVILAVVFLAIGVGNWNLIWPFILIGIGLTVLLRRR